MWRVRFEDVGRSKACWVETSSKPEPPSEEWLEVRVEQRRVLMSHGISCSGGIVYAGMRAVGRYTIEPMTA